MNVAPLVVGLFGVVVTARGLINGSGSPSGQNFRREDEPEGYWFIMAVSTVVSAYLIYFAFTDHS